MSRAVLSAVTLSCSCGGTIVPVCLEDRAASGDESAISELCWRETMSAVQSERGKAGARMRAIGRAVERGQARRRAALAGVVSADDLPF
jgi:hypothetical protein